MKEKETTTFDCSPISVEGILRAFIQTKDRDRQNKIHNRSGGERE